MAIPRLLDSVLLLLLVPIVTIEGAKVLLLPMVGASHTINFAQVGDALTKRGHQVYAYVNVDCGTTSRLTKVGVELITYNNTVGGCIMESEEMTSGLTKTLDDPNFGILQMFGLLKAWLPLIKSEVKSALAEEKAIREMKKMDYDLIIVDGLAFNKHVYVMAYMLNKPVVSIMAMFNPFEAGIPAMPSIYPTPYVGVTAQMSFTDRLKNMGGQILFELMLPLFLPNMDNNLVSTYVTDRPYKSISEISAQTKLWLLMSDDLIDYAKVTVPSVIKVGGFNTNPAQPLSEEIKSIADQAKNGLILVSFGSRTVVNDRILQIFFKVFRSLPQTIIMRHTDTKVENIPKNVHLFKWVPQNDLLGHPNVKLFITHGGCNGQFEGLYHAVPMLSMPFGAEQEYNAKRVEYHGIGTTLNLRKATGTGLKDAITTIIADTSYSERIKQKAKAFKDRPMTPMETAVYWIEHVIKYGGDELRPVSVDLPFYQFWCLDLMVFIIVILFVVLIVVCKILKCICGFCCQKKAEQHELAKRKTQ